MGYFTINGASSGPAVYPPEEMAILRDPALLSFVDFNDARQRVHEPVQTIISKTGRIKQIRDKANGGLFTWNSPSPSAGYTLSDIGSDGQKALTLASNHGVFISEENVFPASGDFSGLAIFQQNAGADGYAICSNEDANTFIAGWASNNSLRIYTKFSANLYQPGATNDGGVKCLIFAYNATSSTLAVWLNGTLLTTHSSVVAPVRTDLKLRVGGYRTTGSIYGGVVDGKINCTQIFGKSGAESSNFIDMLKAFAAQRFPTESWAT